MHQRGFSLIELVVTIAVLALILMAAVPGMGLWLENTRIRNVADSIQTGLQLARSEAVRRNQSISFHLVSLSNPGVLSNDCTLSGSSGSWVVSVSAPTSHCADEPSTTTAPMIVSGRPVGDAGGKVSVTSVQSDSSTPGTTATFNGLGRLTNTDAISQVIVNGTNSDTNYRKLSIEVSPAGAVRMCDPAVTDATDPRKCRT